jgi:hypothetical protein
MRALFLSAAVAGLLLAQGNQERPPARPGVGDAAPAFRLNDHSGRAVAIAAKSSGEEAPWTVLAFFPKAATPG